jgi:3-hydroxybutyryl-CoA dehydrogenase
MANTDGESPTRIGVIGAGVMGSGIAQCTATAGIETWCYDVAPEALKRARERVSSGRYGLQRGVERGKLAQADADAALARLHFSDHFEEAANADIVIECVPERLDLKIKTFRALDRSAPPHAVLASNTSGFSIAGLAAATDRPERVVGWHWASPPVVMRFAEIVRGPETSEESLAAVCRAAELCGKNPIVVRDNPMAWGFVANRIYGAMLREAGRVVEEGIADAGDINQLMVDCFNWPVGPFAMVKGATEGWKDPG